MNLSNIYLNQSPMFIPTAEHLSQQNSELIPILNYPEYLTNDYDMSIDYIQYQPQASFIYPQEQIMNINKIYVNPFFKARSPNRTSELSSSSSSGIEKDSLLSIEQQEKNSSLSSRSRTSELSLSSEIEKDRSLSIEQQQKNSSLLTRTRTRSLSSDRPIIITPKKNHRVRQIRKKQREKLIQEKELIFKRSMSNRKHRRSSPDRWEHKEEKLKRLYKEYSTEDLYQQWKPLIIDECLELYQYAYDKYKGKSI